MINQYIMYFMIYSFIGWILESVYRSLFELKRPVNSGFLYGPFIPIYGFGALSFVFFYPMISHLSILLQMLIFSLSASLLEYATSSFLERRYNMKLWDYSHMFLNIKGRVCLLNSGYWAILSWLLNFYIHPLVKSAFRTIPHNVYQSILIIFSIYFLVDFYLSADMYGRVASLFSKSGEVLSKLSGLNLRFAKRILYVFPNTGKKISELLLEKDEYLIADAWSKREFERICWNTVSHPRYLELKNYRHHDKDIYSHNLEVAWRAYNLAKRFNLKVEETVRGALLHDFFFYDWRTEKPEGRLPHGFTHPVESRRNAVETFGNLSKLEKDIIEKHMWPLTAVPPLYVESFLVSLIDKTVSSKEFIRHYRQRRKAV